MFATFVLCAGARADTWVAVQDGFVVQPRDDAPTDAMLGYGANFVPAATGTPSGGAPVDLASALLTGVGAEPRVAFLPPVDGWGAGTSWTLSVSGYYGEGEVDSITFTTGTMPAPPPAEVAVGEITVGAWSAPGPYPWGCCRPVRAVQVPISVVEADPWSWVEVVGRFDLGRPSQITTEEIHQHLDLVVGPGDSVLTFDQWEDERGPQPPCFDVVAVSASGLRGAPQTFCADGAGAPAPSETTTGGPTTSSTGGGATTTSGGCDTGPSGAGWLTVAMVLLARRAGRSDA